ncbi:hypothetical protein F3K44_32850 [Bacillus megaterium]|nr:hypothetical protein [Priestia megaterium]
MNNEILCPLCKSTIIGYRKPYEMNSNSGGMMTYIIDDVKYRKHVCTNCKETDPNKNKLKTYSFKRINYDPNSLSSMHDRQRELSRNRRRNAEEIVRIKTGTRMTYCYPIEGVLRFLYVPLVILFLWVDTDYRNIIKLTEFYIILYLPSLLVVMWAKNDFKQLERQNEMMLNEYEEVQNRIDKR